MIPESIINKIVEQSTPASLVLLGALLLAVFLIKHLLQMVKEKDDHLMEVTKIIQELSTTITAVNTTIQSFGPIIQGLLINNKDR